MVDASLPMIITDNSRGKAHGGIHPPLTIPRDSLSRSFSRDIVQTREGEPRCASRPMVRVERKYFYSLISLKLRGESSYLYNY